LFAAIRRQSKGHKASKQQTKQGNWHVTLLVALNYRAKLSSHDKNDDDDDDNINIVDKKGKLKSFSLCWQFVVFADREKHETIF